MRGLRSQSARFRFVGCGKSSVGNRRFDAVAYLSGLPLGLCTLDVIAQLFLDSCRLKTLRVFHNRAAIDP
ncbi:hypothetical protein DC425_16990 [Sphingomonas sp. TPD3009]|jgi:hypothetical protein|nr:hypothetical protein DC425_16990 [Sphingomonas sp. TPD3009]